MKTSKLLYITALASAMAIGATAKTGEGLKVYINPGHGGHESNDRNVVIEPYEQGDPNGYWESNSNLSKGLQLRDMLEAKGYKVVMSRVTNTSDDDLGLSTIVRLSNESNANLFFSIHSNATGTSSRRNFPLMLFRGYDDAPENPASKELCIVLNKYLLQNQATYWTSTAQNVRGDWTFYPAWNGAGLGVLRGNKITGMLSEGSFHDYIPEAYRLMSDDFCWLEAWHFRKAIDEFLGVEGVTTGAIAGRLNDNRVPRPGDYITFGDDKKATVQNALVELVDAAGNVVATYKTHPIHVNGFYLFKDLKPGTYKVRASVETHMPVESDEIEVKADEVSYCNMQMARVRNTPPAVVSYTPEWKDGDAAVLCNTPVSFHYNWDMDAATTEKAFKIEPAAEGTFEWSDLNYCMTFKPTKAYERNTVYTVTLDASACHGGGTPMEKPVSFQFKTTDRNFMEILGQFPKDNEEVHYQNAVIEFRFDKQPNTTPVLNQLTCTDSQGNEVKLNKRSMKTSKSGSRYGFFRIPLLKDLTVGETYNLTLSDQFGDRDGITIKEAINVKFTAVDAGAEKTSMGEVDEMDNAANAVFDAEGSANVAKASAAAGSDKLSGEGSTALTYEFSADEGGEARWSLAEASATEIQPGERLGVHINGDLTNNEVYLELTSDVSTVYAKVCNMDFLGWRYFDINVPAEGVSRLTGVKVVQTPSQMSHSGTVMIDRVFKTKSLGVNDIAADADATVTVYPNPASEYLIANAGSLIESVELLNMNGQTVAGTRGNVLEVNGVENGSYLAKVKTAAGYTVHKVIVKH